MIGLKTLVNNRQIYVLGNSDGFLGLGKSGINYHHFSLHQYFPRDEVAAAFAEINSQWGPNWAGPVPAAAAKRAGTAGGSCRRERGDMSNNVRRPRLGILGPLFPVCFGEEITSLKLLTFRQRPRYSRGGCISSSESALHLC